MLTSHKSLLQAIYLPEQHQSVVKQIQTDKKKIKIIYLYYQPAYLFCQHLNIINSEAATSLIISLMMLYYLYHTVKELHHAYNIPQSVLNRMPYTGYICIFL